MALAPRSDRIAVLFAAVQMSAPGTSRQSHFGCFRSEADIEHKAEFIIVPVRAIATSIDPKVGSSQIPN
jgi:hypothetical protein